MAKTRERKAATRRYCDRPLPPYRYLPGRNPHPVRHPAGHSFGMEPKPSLAFRAEDWAACPDYLYAVDLFNHRYWWEVHEVLEGLWVAAGRRTETGQFLQGLIQIAAGALQWSLGHRDAARRLASAGRSRIARSRGIDLGIDVASLFREVGAYFSGSCDAPPVIHLRES